ncbi:MAG: hypothetical protein Q9160_006534 [Pyrenula sp. 1 TL-2023]
MAFHRPTTHQDDDKFASTDVAKTTSRDVGPRTDLDQDEEAYGKRPSKEYPRDEKHTFIEQPPAYDEEQVVKGETVVSTAEDLVTQVIHVQDDPTLNWAIRLRFRSTRNLPVQTSNGQRVSDLLGGDQLCWLQLLRA